MSDLRRRVREKGVALRVMADVVTKRYAAPSSQAGPLRGENAVPRTNLDARPRRRHRRGLLRELFSATHIQTAFFICLIAVYALISAPQLAAARYASFIIDVNTGKVLHAVNPDTRNYPASLTKMMTLYLVFQALDQGRLHLNEKLTVSRHAARQQPSKLGLNAGEKISVRDAIRAVAIKSANDIAVVLGERLGGSERKFALMMTAEARKLGMKRTTFRNASGLPNRGQMSTARDMATLALAIIRDYPKKYHYFSEETFNYDGSTFRNHNKLLTTYDGMDGVKTGYIRASGFNLVASVRRGGTRLIGVIFGGKTSRKRNAQMTAILNRAFAKIDRGQTQTASRRRTRGAEKKMARVKTAAPDVRTSPRWGVQVGAYKRYDPAFAIATKAVDKAPRSLTDGTVKVVPLRARGGPVYRARIVGLSKRQAYRACRTLKKKDVDCMTLRLKNSVELASN
ncbi:D-alanyl-D-alanine carboxypeptidase family protein [Varunaivibrio sulfuroxidans]|uniref:D-alanyl-D-alanine carboxypeptidase n=1 Tax=Varunaivibrio sulfuroxidans TaxID=1773489 RepID=A0A4V2UNA1_9PROT|nr:D-alanyl-D-alanine carboxypeptidase family protein [Varunaivibrio sulfuroxidans]TCS61261.1 D-alanyl-D-alanine carboxypeptidase [Varunaivibrio sulfuroxidans]WES31119.1 D-alanyl-D-alanine carboxypeptidase [Varunaivibrio sulfuroxidans]